MSEVKHEVLLQAKGIYKNFETSKKDQAVHALTNVDLTLYRGETLALVGESGCGKSTLGRTLIRMLPATRGSVTFEGQNITAMKDKEFAPLCAALLGGTVSSVFYRVDNILGRSSAFHPHGVG